MFIFIYLYAIYPLYIQIHKGIYLHIYVYVLNRFHIYIYIPPPTLP